MEINCKHIADLPQVAKALLQTYPTQRIFALRGQMGAGKTTFMQAMLTCLGSDNEASSPTFALVNEYELPEENLCYHFDFYRIKNIEEAINIGLEEYLYSGYYCFIEWAEKIKDLLPEDTVNVYISVDENSLERVFSF